MNIIEGDLLNCDCNHIAHCANCFHTMGGGIARQIKEQYPEAYQADLTTGKGDKKKLGTFSFAQVYDINIYNLYGQYDFGGLKVNLDYDALKRCLAALREHLDYHNDGTIILGFPWLIGCALAGGDWDIVKPMVEDIFRDSEYPVYWVRYNQ